MDIATPAPKLTKGNQSGNLSLSKSKTKAKPKLSTQQTENENPDPISTKPAQKDLP